MTKTKTTKQYLDVKGSEQIQRVWEFCEQHKFDYEIIPMRLFPIWYRIKFNNPKHHLITALAV